MTDNNQYPTNTYSVESEESLLGGLLLECSAFDRICSIVDTKDFYLQENREIFDAMIRVYKDSNTIDVALVHSELMNRNKDYLTYLLQIQNQTNATSALTSYANNIKKRSVLRKYYNFLCIAKNEVETNSRNLDVKTQITQFENAIYNLFQDMEKTEKPIQDIKDCIVSEIQELNKLKDDPKANQGLMSGFIDLDKKTNGFHGGELIVIAARPSCGKTAFGVNILENTMFCQSGNKSSLFFSIEMPAKQITQRVISSNFKIKLQQLKQPITMLASDWTKIQDGATRLKYTTNTIFIDDTSDMTPSLLRAKAKRLYNELGGLSCILVDYLQLMHAPGFNDNRTLEVTEISHALKALAKELNIPVIALAQLNRTNEQRKDKKPICSDIRESGAIEQDADLILLLHRDFIYTKADNDANKATLIVGKNRHGEIGDIPLIFNGANSRFENYSFQTQQQQQ